MPHIAHVCLMIVLAAALGACSDDGGGAGEATTDAGSDAADTGVEADTATADEDHAGDRSDEGLF